MRRISLGADWVADAARLALASPFLLSGTMKLADFGGATAEVRALTGLEPAAVVAAVLIAVQLGGSALLLFAGSLRWIGAGLLAGFTVAATLIAHDWWTKTGIDAARDFVILWEHVAICGGLLLAAGLSYREHS